MNFLDIAQNRQSCRGYDELRPVEQEKLDAILQSTRLSPSACNGQPYHFTICRGETAKQVAAATQGMGMNKFSSQAPVLIVISEMPYVKSAALGAKVKGNACAYLTAEATAQGLSTCILGWFDDDKIRKICDLSHPVRLVITLGYAKDEIIRDKKRKDTADLVTYLD